MVAIVPAAGHSEDDVLRLAASVERSSEHPLAAAIVAAANERKIALAQVMGFDSPAGKGAIGMVEHKRVGLGNAKFLAELGIGVSLVAIALTFALITYQRHVIRRTGSVAFGVTRSLRARALPS